MVASPRSAPRRGAAAGPQDRTATSPAALQIGPRNRRRKNGGYSLLEILIVVAIIGLLVTLVAPQLFGRLDQSRVTAATAQIRMLRSAVDSFRLDNGRYPTEAEGLNALVVAPGGDLAETWRGPYLDGGRLPSDPWGNPYGYAPTGSADGPAIFSLGADGKPGGAQTAKDLGNVPLTP